MKERSKCSYEGRSTFPSFPETQKVSAQGSNIFDQWAHIKYKNIAMYF